MKRLILFLMLLGFGVLLFGQVTPVSDLRVANATTAFGINLPIGTKVYNVADGKYWVATAGVVSTLTLTTGSASFTQLNPDGSQFVKTDQSTPQTIGLTGARLTKLWVTDITVTNAITGSITGNAATVTTNANLTGDVTSTGNATTVVKINGTSLAALGTGILKNTTSTGVPSIAIASDFPTLNQNTTGTAANVTGTVAVTNGGTGLTTLTSGSYLIGNGTGNVTFKTPAQVLSDIGGAATSAASLFKVQSFTEATTGSTGQVNTLSSTPKASTAIQVILNGMPLLASQYTYTSATPSVQITIPVYQYDAVTISYGY